MNNIMNRNVSSSNSTFAPKLNSKWNSCATHFSSISWNLESRSNNSHLLQFGLALEARGASPFQPLQKKQGCHNYVILTHKEEHKNEYQLLYHRCIHNMHSFANRTLSASFWWPSSSTHIPLLQSKSHNHSRDITAWLAHTILSECYFLGNVHLLSLLNEDFILFIITLSLQHSNRNM